MMYWWVAIWFLLGVAAGISAVYYAYQELHPAPVSTESPE